MKKIFLLSSLLVCFIFISCGDDDDAINNSIEGTWKLIAVDNNGNGNDSVLIDCEKQTTYTFTSNSVTASRYEVNSDDDTDCLPVQNFEVSYRTEGNQLLYLDAEGAPITSNESVLTFSVAENILEIVDSDPGTNEEVSVEIFERQ